MKKQDTFPTVLHETFQNLENLKAVLKFKKSLDDAGITNCHLFVAKKKEKSEPSVFSLPIQSKVPLEFQLIENKYTKRRRQMGFSLTKDLTIVLYYKARGCRALGNATKNLPEEIIKKLVAGVIAAEVQKTPVMPSAPVSGKMDGAPDLVQWMVTAPVEAVTKQKHENDLGMEIPTLEFIHQCLITNPTFRNVIDIFIKEKKQCCSISLSGDKRFNGPTGGYLVTFCGPDRKLSNLSPAILNAFNPQTAFIGDSKGEVQRMLKTSKWIPGVILIFDWFQFPGSRAFFLTNIYGGLEVYDINSLEKLESLIPDTQGNNIMKPTPEPFSFLMAPKMEIGELPILLNSNCWEIFTRHVRAAPGNLTNERKHFLSLFPKGSFASYVLEMAFLYDCKIGMVHHGYAPGQLQFYCDYITLKNRSSGSEKVFTIFFERDLIHGEPDPTVLFRIQFDPEQFQARNYNLCIYTNGKIGIQHSPKNEENVFQYLRTNLQPQPWDRAPSFMTPWCQPNLVQPYPGFIPENSASYPKSVRYIDPAQPVPTDPAQGVSVLSPSQVKRKKKNELIISTMVDLAESQLFSADCLAKLFEMLFKDDHA